VFRAEPEGIDELQHRVRAGISNLKGLDIGDELGVEILSQLVKGRRTSSEITTFVYGQKRGDDGFESSYSRVRREIRKLESKGLISRNLFGRDRPSTHLRTRYGEAQAEWQENHYRDLSQENN
jgi:hypothetical protein